MDTYKKPWLRKLIGCQPDDYTRSCVWVDSKSVINHVTKPKQEMCYDLVRLKPRKALTDEQIDTTAYHYGHLGYEDLPQWLQGELSTLTTLQRNTRLPSELEQWDTVVDAYEHRITNKEMTTKDYLNKYNINKETIT